VERWKRYEAGARSPCLRAPLEKLNETTAGGAVLRAGSCAFGAFLAIDAIPSAPPFKPLDFLGWFLITFFSQADFVSQNDPNIHPLKTHLGQANVLV